MNPILLCGKIFVIPCGCLYFNLQNQSTILRAFGQHHLQLPQIRVSNLSQVWKSHTDVQNMVDTLI